MAAKKRNILAGLRFCEVYATRFIETGAVDVDYAAFVAAREAKIDYLGGSAVEHYVLQLNVEVAHVALFKMPQSVQDLLYEHQHSV